jgi:hypothetical protein
MSEDGVGLAQAQARPRQMARSHADRSLRRNLESRTCTGLPAHRWPPAASERVSRCLRCTGCHRCMQCRAPQKTPGPADGGAGCACDGRHGVVQGCRGCPCAVRRRVFRLFWDALQLMGWIRVVGLRLLNRHLRGRDLHSRACVMSVGFHEIESRHTSRGGDELVESQSISNRLSSAAQAPGRTTSLRNRAEPVRAAYRYPQSWGRSDSCSHNAQPSTHHSKSVGHRSRP